MIQHLLEAAHHSDDVHTFIHSVVHEYLFTDIGNEEQFLQDFLENVLHYVKVNLTPPVIVEILQLSISTKKRLFINLQI